MVNTAPIYECKPLYLLWIGPYLIIAIKRARASSTMNVGACSIFFAPRPSRSSVLIALTSITPWVCVPDPMRFIAKPAYLAKLPPCVMGATSETPSILKERGESTSAGRISPCCSLPTVGLRQTRTISPRSKQDTLTMTLCRLLAYPAIVLYRGSVALPGHTGLTVSLKYIAEPLS